VNDVYVDPADSKHVLLATDRRGVLASEDGGDTFVPSNAGFSARQITAFSADSRHAATVYVGVVNDKDSGGVFVSHTGGLSWTHLGDGLDGRDVLSLVQAPDGTMLAGTEHGIYVLKDASWQRVGADPDVHPVAGAAQGKPAKSKPVQKPGRNAAARKRAVAKPRVPAAGGALKSFDGTVYGLAVSGDAVIAVTSQGVLRGTSNGARWSAAAGLPVQEWRFVAASKAAIAVASLSLIEVSGDNGNTWKAVALPPNVSQISALAVDDERQVWVGTREGVYVSADNGATWQAPANMVARVVNSIFYDEPNARMLITAREPATLAFAVDVRSRQPTTWETGWSLRFVRPVGDHLVAATLFDGIIVQPRMVDSAEIAKH
jgi:photosystem II stability/assembly factor-like uncharacterized protein